MKYAEEMFTIISSFIDKTGDFLYIFHNRIIELRFSECMG